MATAIIILFALWLGSGIVALAACILSSRLSRAVDEPLGLTIDAPEMVTPLALRKAS